MISIPACTEPPLTPLVFTDTPSISKVFHHSTWSAMTTRPTIRPSSTRPRLPISVDGETYRALPSPSSISPKSRSTRSISRPTTTLGTRREHPPRQDSHSHTHDSTPYSASYRHRIWEEDQHSRSSSTAPVSAGSMMSPSATLYPHQMEGYFPTQFQHDATPQYPPQVVPLSEAPRNPGGGKKQQSGRKRTACDRCKRQKSSVCPTYCSRLRLIIVY